MKEIFTILSDIKKRINIPCDIGVNLGDQDLTVYTDFYNDGYRYSKRYECKLIENISSSVDLIEEYVSSALAEYYTCIHGEE